jgi:hypothetical protein
MESAFLLQWRQTPGLANVKKLPNHHFKLAMQSHEDLIWRQTKTATNAIAPGVTVVICQTFPCVFGAGGLLLEIDVAPKRIVLSI